MPPLPYEAAGVPILGKLIWHCSYCSGSVPGYCCKSLILKGKHVKTIFGLFQRQCICCYLSYPFIPWHTYLIVYWYARKKVSGLTSFSQIFLKLTSSNRWFFCFNRVFKVQLIKFFIWRKNGIRFSRYLDICIFHESANLIFYDSMVYIIAYEKISFLFFLLNNKKKSKWNLV